MVPGEGSVTSRYSPLYLKTARRITLRRPLPLLKVALARFQFFALRKPFSFASR